MLFPLGFRVRDMKADNSLPVVGQSFKELCNLPTSFTLSWNSRLKLDAGWTLAVQFESFSEAKVKQLQRGVFSQCHFENHFVRRNVLREPTALLPRCFHKSWLTREATGQHGNNLCGSFSCSEVSFFRMLYCILGWFLFFSQFPLLPHRLSSSFCPSRKSNIKQIRGKEWVTRPYSKCCELWTAKPGIGQELEFQQHGKAWAHSPGGWGVLLSLCCRMLCPSRSEPSLPWLPLLFRTQNSL